MKMDKKEKVQDFNQRFTTLLSSLSVANKPAEESLIDYYTTTLYPPIAMFVKRAFKPTSIENYDESNWVEVDLDSIEKHTS